MPAWLASRRLPVKELVTSAEWGELSRWMPTTFPTMRFPEASIASESLSPMPMPLMPAELANTFSRSRMSAEYIRNAPTSLPSKRFLSKTLWLLYM
jgi:hypothetical protein